MRVAAAIGMSGAPRRREVGLVPASRARPRPGARLRPASGPPRRRGARLPPAGVVVTTLRVRPVNDRRPREGPGVARPVRPLLAAGLAVGPPAAAPPHPVRLPSGATRTEVEARRRDADARLLNEGC